MEVIVYLRQLNFVSVFIRLVLAVVFGGIIGSERGKKRRAAGLRTYMLVCLGATITMILGQYEADLTMRLWDGNFAGAKVDVARFGAQVVNGIGFLGAGTILHTGKSEIKGVTTAAGLWASACTGLALGAGFYEAVLPTFLLILICMLVFPRIEEFISEHSRDINLYIQFRNLDKMNELIAFLKSASIHIYNIEIIRGEEAHELHSGVKMSLGLPKRLHRTTFLKELTSIEDAEVIKEI